MTGPPSAHLSVELPGSLSAGPLVDPSVGQSDFLSAVLLVGLSVGSSAALSVGLSVDLMGFLSAGLLAELSVGLLADLTVD
jgi:hypothetical protein